MNQPHGRSFRVSPFRRLVADLMHFSRSVPSIIFERPMTLGPLVEARAARKPAPTWSALISKAYAIVCARNPLLRTAYLRFPWPRFYEHPTTTAILNIDRQLADERIVLHARVESPETLSLDEIDALIREHQQAPVESLSAYRDAMWLARIPWPFRRIIWWAALNVFGSTRSHYFGNFGMSSVAPQGAGIVKLIPILTTTLHYGLLNDAGELTMRLSFDHRVFDGAVAAKALVDLEEALLGPVLEECRRGRPLLPYEGMAGADVAVRS